MEPTGRVRQSGIWLIVASIVLATVTVLVALQEKPIPLTVGLLQGITLVFGTFGSYALGKDTSREAAKELVRPHARSAFRRVQNLYRALGRQQAAIAAERARLSLLKTDDENELILFAHANASLLTLEYMVVEQIGTADDALEDWRDLVPEEVKQIEAAGLKREEEDSGAH